LGGLPFVELGFAPATLPGPGKTRFARGVHHEHDVAHGSPTGFEQKWSIEYHGRPPSRSHFAAFDFQPAPNSRVQQIFQEFPIHGFRFAMAEHALGNRGPIDAAVGRENAVAPTLPQRLPHFRVHSKNGVTGSVRIEQTRSKLHQHLRNSRLTAGHAADKTDGFHAIHDRWVTKLRRLIGS
jgi:hypothetical protein